MKNHVLDVSTICVLMFLMYLIWCFIDYQILPASFEIKDYYLSNGQFHPDAIPYDPKKPILVTRGENLSIGFIVNHYRRGSVHVERFVLEDERLFLSLTRMRANELGKTESIALYHIPTFLHSGCNHAVMSRNHYYLSYNILTLFNPKVMTTPKIPFCLTD